VTTRSSPCWLPWIAGTGLALASTLVLALLATRPAAPDEQIALVFAPWTQAGETLAGVAALDGRLVRVGSFDNVLVAVFDRPKSLASLRRHGVWLALDPLALGGCLSQPTAARGTLGPALRQGSPT